MGETIYHGRKEIDKETAYKDASHTDEEKPVELRKLAVMERTIREKLKTFCDSLYEEIKEMPSLEGAMPYLSTSGTVQYGCCLVGLSVIKNSGSSGMILSPHYYIQEKQAQIVKDGLRGTDSVTGILGRMREMYEQKRVRVGSVSYILNPVTLGILKKYLDG